MNYTKLKDAYYGTGGYSDGSYLIQHPRESAKKYKQRQQLSYYLNYMAAVVNAHVDPIFKQQIQRDFSGAGSSLFSAFTADVDMCGTSFADFVRRAALSAKLYGTAIIVMDNVEQQPATEAEALETRAMPYMYTVDHSLITTTETDKYGRLTTLAYKELMPPAEAKAAIAAHKQPYYLRVWTQDGWYLYDSDGKQVISQGSHNLGRVPAVIFHSRNMDSSVVLQPSEFASIQQTNDQIYQLSSWLTEIFANQTFSILVLPKTGENDPGTVTLGVDNAIAFPADSSNTPGFISPPSDPATVLQSQIDKLVKEIYRMASLSYATGTKQVSSGISKQWDFEAQNTVLNNFAHEAKIAENSIVELFSRWVNKDIDYNVTYPTDYNLVDISDELDKAIKALSIDTNVDYRREVIAKVLDAYLPNLDDATKEKILSNISVPVAVTQTAQTDENSQAE